jgi:hypothetical protein
MVEFVVGVAVGAAFAPMWMKVWTVVRNLPYVKPVVDSVARFFH